ncbi:hypothetical protein DT73_13120 [Mangrovibacter sp. MFB070]|uniref:phage portal protein n=1 Tax=Mangrovibacter sp. MFB070 TaxID=1224318 RepID=UPI0004D591AF|nr:phage portal protein [Mangrovibacter sp. MFB070]KEA51869.1 hypothetical protein DT73_13120 [Mangrovibacter sp. MFB070]
MFNFFRKKPQPPEQVRKLQVQKITGQLKREIDAIRRPIIDLGIGGVSSTNINQVLRYVLTPARNKSRELAVNNPVAKRYVVQCADGVTGADGITIRPTPISANPDLGNALEQLFYTWAEDPEQFSINGQLTIDLFQQLVEKTRAVDGECFIRIHKDMKVEIIDAARLSSSKVGLLPGGSYISNSIEFDQYGKPLAYYVCRYNPVTYLVDYSTYERIPADEIIHYYIPDFAGQERGIPDLLCVAENLKDLSTFIEAALIQKKISASSMGFITNSNTDNMMIDENTSTASYSEYYEPGAIFELNPGQDVKTINPNSGVDQIDTFISELMTQVAMGLNISKQNLTMDTSNASFSASKLSDKLQQSTFKTRSNVMITKVLKPLYQRWLSNYMMTINTLKLQFSEYTNLSQARYIPVKHISIDPQRDAQERQTYLEMGVMSKTQIILDMGGEPEKVFAEIKKENEENGIQQNPNQGDEPNNSTT